MVFLSLDILRGSPRALVIGFGKGCVSEARLKSCLHVKEKTRTKNHRSHLVTWVYKVFTFLLKLNSIKYLLFFFLWGTNFGG